MNIRQKILIYFSVLSITLIGISFIMIYALFSSYRTEEFQQRIKDKTITTLKFLIEVKQIDNDLLQTIDKFTINNLYREKTLIYNSNKNLIYASLDDTKIEFPNSILNQLSPQNPIIEYQEDNFDVIGIYFEHDNSNYYGISKAYDKYGLSKLKYLKFVLLIILLIFSALVLISSFILSKQISDPIINMASELKSINLDTSDSYIKIPNSKDEIEQLAIIFNELMVKLKDSFSFQKYATQHISHELKTPIAQLVSNFEKMENETNVQKLKELLQFQKEGTKNLAEIINTLLEISKLESGNKINKDIIRIDELLYEVIEEINLLNKTFKFSINLDQHIENEENLILHGNKKLIKLALANLSINCIQYSSDNKSEIKISNDQSDLIIEFLNNGMIISEYEKQFMFQRFYRGNNSKGKRGFGLGLVLTSKIASIHKGKLSYSSINDSINNFKLSIPLK